MAKTIILTVNTETGQAVKNIDELNSAIQSLEGELKSLKEAGKGVGDADFDKLTNKLKVAKTEVKNFNSELKKNASDNKKIAETAVDGFGKIGEAAGYAKEATIAQNTAQKLLNLTMEANPIGVVIALVTGLVSIFTELYQKSETVREGIKGLFAGIKAAVTGYGKLIFDYFGGLGNIIAGVFTLDLDKIKEGFNQSKNAFVTYGNNIVKSASDAISKTAADATKVTINNVQKQLDEVTKQLEDTEAGTALFASLEKKKKDLEAKLKQLKGETDKPSGGGGGGSGKKDTAAADAEKAAADAKKAADLLVETNNQADLQILQNRIDAAEEGTAKLVAEQDKLIKEKSILDEEAAAKKQEIDAARAAGASDEVIKQKEAELKVIEAKSEASAVAIKNKANQISKQQAEDNSKNIDEGLKTAQDANKKETESRIDSLNKQLAAAKGNKAEEIRLKYEILKVKLDGDIQEVQSALDAYKAKRLLNGQLTKEEADNEKELQNKLAALKKEGADNDAKQQAETDAANDDKRKQRTKDILDTAKATADVVNQIIAEANRRAQEDIQNRLALNEQAKTDRLSQLDAEYQKEKEIRGSSAALDKKYFERKKQVEAEYEKQKAALQLEAWKKEKEAKLKTSIINTALAVGTALASAEPPRSFFLAGIAGAAGLAQTIIIAAQEPPKFSRGGILNGPRHSQGGISLYNRGGSVMGEAEGGEIILNRNVSNYPGLVSLASAINERTGGISFSSYDPISAAMARSRTFEHGGIIRPVQKFADGGIINGVVGTQISSFENAIDRLSTEFRNTPRAYVVEQDITSIQNKNALIERRAKLM